MTGPPRGLTGEGWGTASSSVQGRLLGMATSAGWHGLGSPSPLDIDPASPVSTGHPPPPSLSIRGWRGVLSTAVGVGAAGRLLVKFRVWGGALPKVHLPPQLPHSPAARGRAGPGSACGWAHINLFSSPGPREACTLGGRGGSSGSRAGDAGERLPSGLPFPLQPAGAEGLSLPQA